MNQVAREILTQIGEAFTAWDRDRLAHQPAPPMPVRRTAVAHLPWLGGVAVASTTDKLIRTLADMGPCDWTTLTVGVVNGQLVAQADALDPPPTRTPTPPHTPHAQQTR